MLRFGNKDSDILYMMIDKEDAIDNNNTKSY